MEDLTVGLHEGVCPVCKKKYFFRPEYIYSARIKGKPERVCSWTCMRKCEKPDKRLRGDYFNEHYNEYQKERQHEYQKRKREEGTDDSSVDN